MNPAACTAWIVARARALGFDLCDVAGVGDLEQSEELARLPEWLAQGYAGEMGYLHDARRRAPAQALEGACSIIVCAVNYNTAHPYSTIAAREPARGWISRYAWGDDYHEVLGSKLEALIAAMREAFAEPFEARAYVDTGPIAERIAARYAGLGELGKNTCLIHPELGSWLFLGVIITTLELAPSLSAELPPHDLCGQCTLCIEACPTGAIVEPHVLDARRCISYLTIELRGSIPKELRGPMGRHVFGCDICQDVCPYNRAAPVSNERAFEPRQMAQEIPRSDARAASLRMEDHDAQTIFAPELERLISMGEHEFRAHFRGSAIKRTKWRGLLRNACVALGNSGLSPADASYQRIINRLERLAAGEDAIIAEHAQWALTRLKSSSPVN